MTSNKNKYFRLEALNDGLLMLCLTDPDEPLNTLKLEMVEEFDQMLDQIQKNRNAKALIFTSGKADNFLAGANLEMLQGVSDSLQGTALAELSQKINNRIANLSIPTIAAIHGACLGGGLELALDFDARIASTHKATKLGFPEVQLGLLPGGGGTQRITRLLPLAPALDLLLSGRQLNAHKAKKLGLVDEVVAMELLIPAAQKLAIKLLAGKPARKRKSWLKPATWVDLLLKRTPLGRSIVFRQARKQVLKKTQGHYPAPLRIIDVVSLGLSRGLSRGLKAEAQAFGELLVTPVATQLINLFFAHTALKNDSGVQQSASPVKQIPISKIGVLGAGLMGAGIAYTSISRANVHVRIKDRDHAGVAHGLKYIFKLLDKQRSRKRLNQLEFEQTFARISGTIDYQGFADCQLVIEAVFEDLKLKQTIVNDIEAITDKNTIFATNTSALPIKDIASASKHPETIIGMHYFSPVEKMPLLEIVVTDQTADWVTASCVAFGKKQGKTVIVVNDGPGFYTTRVLATLMMQAVTLVIEGVAIEQIDKAMRNIGFPLGPIQLLDEVGIDVGEKVLTTMTQSFSERFNIPDGLGKMLAEKRLGRKSKRGFYLYDGKASSKQVDNSVYKTLNAAPRCKISDELIVKRCLLAFVNEAILCLQDGVLRSARDGDIGAVFGLGFPPYLGGPFRYAESLGLNKLITELTELENNHGASFCPADLLKQHSRSKKLFYQKPE